MGEYKGYSQKSKTSHIICQIKSCPWGIHNLPLRVILRTDHNHKVNYVDLIFRCHFIFSSDNNNIWMASYIYIYIVWCCSWFYCTGSYVGLTISLAIQTKALYIFMLYAHLLCVLSFLPKPPHGSKFSWDNIFVILSNALCIIKILASKISTL